MTTRLNNSSISTSGNIIGDTVTAIGNITASYLIGNGSQLTGVVATSSYGNANVAANLAAFANNPILTTGNIGAGNINVTTSTGNLVFGKASATGSPGLNSTSSVTVVTNRFGTPKEWVFGTDGSFAGAGNIGTSANIAGNYFIGNGSQLTGISAGANTGNIGFTGDAIYDLNGMIIENADLSHAATAAVVLPANGDANAIQVNNTYGNIVLQTGAGSGITASWSFNNDGTTNFPTLTVDLHNGGTQTGQTLQFGDPAQQAFITGPTPAVDTNAQRLIIQGQRGSGTGEGGDVYVWGGDSDANGGDIKIYAGDADTAGRGGNIHIAGGRGTTSGGSEILITGGQVDGGNGAPVIVTGGRGTATGGAVSLNGGFGEVTGGDINIIGGIGGNGLGSYGNVGISAGASSWAFDNTGNLTLPQAGVVYETNIPFGGLEGKTIALKPYGGTNADQQLLVYPTAGADFNHLHLTTGNLWNTEMFLGNDDFYVKLANTGNIVINTSDNTGNTAQWTFGTQGTILNSGNLTLQTPNGVPGAVTAITGSSGSWEANPVSNLATTGGTGTGLTVNVTQEGGYAGTIAIATAGTGYSNGDSISVVSGSSDASFTISVIANEWTLDTAGNLTVAGSIIMPPNSSLTAVSASPAPSINGFGTISSANVITGTIFLNNGRIVGGEPTVVTDGINSIALALGAQMDVFGFPFTAAGVRGQLTISDVTTPSQANGTWYYQSVSDIAYQLYTNSTYSTLVDATGWSAYTGGGSVAITQQDPEANIVINSNGYFSTFDNTGNLTVPGSVKFTSGSALTFGDTPVTNRYYIDATRTDTYTQNGSQARPFKTIAGAQAAIATAISGGLNPEVEPVYMILLSNITENVTLETNHVYLIGQNGQIHQPIILTGNITVEPTSGTLNNNHFSISGMEIVGGTNGKAIYVTGTYPTRLSLQDMWITANGNSGAGLYQDNTGTGTYTHGGPIKVSHNGVGDVYCFDIRKGTASFDTVETSGATQVGAAGPGATLTFNNSQLDANGNVVVETYGNGVVVVTNSVIKNSAANSSGIRLNAVANVAGTVSVGQSAFNVPLGTGKAVWLDPNTTPGLSGVFAWSGASFYPNTNTTIDTSIIPGPLAILVGTQVSPIFYGDITTYGVAQDWDLIDNNASALSFDTTGKAGVLELVTTNSAEGVKMSGYANVVGNVTGGNILTGGLISATGNITSGNLSVTGNVTGNTGGFAIGYRDIPQVSLSSNVTTALTDAGKHYYSTSASNLTLTIANNTSVGWSVGTAISIVNRGTANITIAPASGVSLYLAGNSTSANRTVTTYGMATVMNVAANIWMINGTVV